MADLVKFFGIGERTILKLARTRGLPLKRIGPGADLLAFESEVVEWLKRQPSIGDKEEKAQRTDG